MRRTTCIASAAWLVLATIALNGCGADDSPSASNASTTATAPNDAAQQPTTAAAVPNASAPFADNTANNTAHSTASNATSGAAATDPITQNMQASLAADSQQVAPVMRYAPGDSANN
ncbi:hypothetical protein EVC45_01050 [Paraburkholderia sp. UYCP14C]|uniref:hypothetical protein n=1 Tax=Paraburkholderia sp. UYCP14C TaxID=2511130 RepID=UPI00101F5C55|nr:hypothetical protein [Paraburkholderia sp. UYCP14C]RZF31682.1 hypothetical protein EVC45_01050 [Paraburkholderia sp. UYCP14C]